jgi:ribonuclease P protein component
MSQREIDETTPPGRDCAAPGQLRLQVVTLKVRREFDRVRGGRRWSGPAFLMEARARPAVEAGLGARFGFTITKKVGGAVERNRMRRRLKAALATLPAEAAHGGFDHVLVVRRAALERPFADLVADLRAALEQVAAPAKSGSRDKRS